MDARPLLRAEAFARAIEQDGQVSRPEGFLTATSAVATSARH
jgi:hypothetical protein